ncbi:choline/ethanolamine kinase [Theileria orientalis strain Shintoku]|uniref:Choline/ethanolamine kinase n=1 Tax=Theileria orientalis strain Shintoku TaxID=869250 RepID=J4C3G1_THEOR|nr:choline/ethanolamine kinase [Theileria orientalis strain Shintoku]BAM40381.1 choline/ethanolamine kinase [Theileria orientalis strain Shintoku]|eukprot:XP_009690682.1 choline/ethanolamine kinase [Theileria orientalis strain Shintoku]
MGQLRKLGTYINLTLDSGSEYLTFNKGRLINYYKWICRELQLNVAELLGENNLGPRVICRCSDYTIQEFVEGTTLKNSSFQNLSVITSLAST